MKDKVRGAIMGTAIGDSLGMPAEGKLPETIEKLYGRITTLRTPKSANNRKPFHRGLKRGMWTDDTQLMLAIGESIVANGSIDYHDIAERHISSFRERRGWGKSTTLAVQRIMTGSNWYDAAEPNGAGNGPPMKIAPLGVCKALNILSDFETLCAVINIAKMTHGHPAATIAALAQAKLVANALKFNGNMLGIALYSLCEKVYELERAVGFVEGESLGEVMELARTLAIKGESDLTIRKTIGARCVVWQSFPFTYAMLNKYWQSTEKCLEAIVNMGGDADTNGAMAGAVLGAAWGLSSFPTRWRKRLEGKRRLLKVADGLLLLAKEK